MVNRFLIVMVLTLVSRFSYSQSTQYEIESFQDAYTELTTYQSMQIETIGDPLWEYEFDLNFAFPFYDSSYTRLYYRYDGLGSVTEDQDDAITLFEFGYEYDIISDTIDIQSDVRFGHTIYNGEEAFVIQFTKCRIDGDTSKSPVDNYLNFQIWFYESGNMEIRFGEIRLDNSPHYVPGEGFYTVPYGGPNPILLGPHVGINYPHDETDAIGIDGAYNDYEVVNSAYGILSVLPPEGWVIRFEYKTSSTNELHLEKLSVHPNPTSSEITISGMNERRNKVEIIDINGTIVAAYSEIAINTLDVSALVPGVYIVRVAGDDVWSGKFVKQ